LNLQLHLQSNLVVGEDIRTGRTALRSSDPNAEGQPDTYKGTFWYAGTADSGGVHTNSGVLNHWFYFSSW
jgi:Zn-dependent metalloprotease